MMTARTTNDGKDGNNDGGNNDSSGGGGGKIGGEVGGVARSVTWLVAVFFAVGSLALTYRRNCTDMFGNKFILINSIWHVRTCQIEFILFVSILGLFYIYSGITSPVTAEGIVVSSLLATC